MEFLDNELNLSFRIWDYEDISHEDITESLGLNPLKVYIKGKPPNPKVKRISKRNGWIYGTSYGNADDFKTQMNKILDILEPKLPILKKYSKKYYCEFSCFIFLNKRDAEIPRIYLGQRYNDFIKNVEAVFDIDICYPPIDKE